MGDGHGDGHGGGNVGADTLLEVGNTSGQTWLSSFAFISMTSKVSARPIRGRRPRLSVKTAVKCQGQHMRICNA